MLRVDGVGGSPCLIWGSLVRSRTAAVVVLMSDATAWRLEERTVVVGGSLSRRSKCGRAPEAAETPPQGPRGVRGLADALPRAIQPRKKTGTRTGLAEWLLV